MLGWLDVSERKLAILVAGMLLVVVFFGQVKDAREKLEKKRAKDQVIQLIDKGLDSWTTRKR